MIYENVALGMIETTGFPALVAAADAASKAADVQVVTYQKADSGIVTIYIIGDVASVQSAVQVGEEVAKRIGTLRHSHIIARPDENVKKMLFQLMEKKKEQETVNVKNEFQNLNAGEMSDKEEKEAELPSVDELYGKNIQELRRIAKSHKKFPIPASEIAKAKKDEIIKGLSELLNEKGGDKQ